MLDFSILFLGLMVMFMLVEVGVEVIKFECFVMGEDVCLIELKIDGESIGFVVLN